MTDKKALPGMERTRGVSVGSTMAGELEICGSELDCRTSQIQVTHSVFFSFFLLRNDPSGRRFGWWLCMPISGEGSTRESAEG